MMLDKKLVHEFPAVCAVHRQIPDGSDREAENRSPEEAQNKCFRRQFPRQKIIKRDNRERKNNPDQAFRNQRDADKKVKQNKRQIFLKTSLFCGFAPLRRIEYKKRNKRSRDRKSQDNVKARAARKNDYTD